VAKFRIAAKIIPDRLQAWRNTGFTLYSIGEIDEAISSFEFVTQFAQSDTATLNVLGILYLGESRDEEAIVQFEKALVHSEQLVTLTNLAVALSRVGDIAASEETYRRALVIDSTYWQSYFNLGSLYWQQSRFDESVEAFELAVRLTPGDVDARYNLAVAYLGLDRVDDAFPLLEALSLDMPDHGLVWRDLGRAYANRGMDAESADAFAKASALGQ
jgi:tetratricopeptide (TPR) repeat protein